MLLSIASFFSSIGKAIRRFFDWVRDLFRRRPPVTPGPKITIVKPFKAYPGSVIDISGSGFDSSLDGNKVKIGGQPARVIRASSTQIKAIASLDANDGPISVEVGGFTGTSPDDFKAKPYPIPGSGEDGPPSYFEGGQNLQQGDLPSTGTMNVLVSLVNPTDEVPTNPANARNDVVSKWDTVHDFYDQASFTALDVDVDVTTGWNTLLNNKAYYLDTSINNIDQSVLDQLVTEAAQAAVDDGRNRADCKI